MRCSRRSEIGCRPPGIAQESFAEVNKQAKRFMSDEHSNVNGTLIQALELQKSFRSKDGSGYGTGFRS
jgi:hypothetical protein